MSQRLSRKEIKRDEFMESLGGAFDYIRGHTRNLIGLAMALLIALILAAVFMGYSDRRQKRADESLVLALRVYQAAVDPVAANPSDPHSPSFATAEARSMRAQELFEALKENFGRSDAAQVATVYLGQIAAQRGDVDGARTYWQEFVARSSDNALAVEVRVNLMSLDRAAGRADELVTELRAMLSTSNTGMPPDLLWYQLALTLEELDRQGEAKEAYQRIVDEYPQSAYASAARERTGSSQSPLFGT